MKKLVFFMMIIGVAGFLPLLAQEEKAESQTTTEVKPTLRARPLFSYNSEGRRDPFKDLLGGSDIRERPATTDPRQMPFEELKLTGITKTRQGWNAILETSQGFPLVVQVGDRFSDGYIISINETQVVFRKTHERGIPLMRARDIIKEINPEER